MTTPLVSALRTEFPDSHIGFLTSHYAVTVLQHNREIDTIYSLKYRKLPYFISPEKQRITREIKKIKWDAIFLLESNPIFASLVSRFRADAIYGFNPPPPPFTTSPFPLLKEGDKGKDKEGKGEFNGITFSPDSHVISNFLKLGELLDRELKEFPMNLPWSDDDFNTVRRLLDRLPINTLRVAIHAGFGPARKKTMGLRSWPIERFRETIARLHKETKASFVLTGTAKEFEINEIIRDGLKIPIFNLAGQTTIPELGALLKEMNLVISIDSSPAHIAAAVGTPLIVLWGPAIETHTRPISLNSPVIVINKHLPCSPCYETPRKENCNNNICMQEIKADDVVEEALKLLKGSSEIN